MLGYYMELFLPQLRYDAGKICVNLANSPLVVEQNNYSTKIVIVYDLNDWPKVLLGNLTLKNVCLEQLIHYKTVIKKSVCMVTME